MTQGKGTSQMSSFLEPLFNRAVTLALLAIVIFLVIYVIAVEQRLRQNASAGDANEVRMAALEDADRKAAAGEQEQTDKLAALEAQMGTFASADDEAAQNAQLTALTQQIEALSQQAATSAANDEAAQAGEAAQSEQIADIQQQLISLNEQADEFASADEAGAADLEALTDQLDAFATHDDLAAL